MKVEKAVSLFGLCGAAFMLAACPPKAYGVIVNAVGEPVSVTVFRSDQPHFSGSLSPSNSLLLTQRTDAVEAVEYRYSDRVCRIEGQGVQSATDNGYGLKQLTLKPCEAVTQP